MSAGKRPSAVAVRFFAAHLKKVVDTFAFDLPLPFA